MLSFIKFLKIALPVATVTSATIATTFLVSSSRNDLSNKGKEEDSILTDFVDLVEDFKERTLFYSKKGDGDGTVALSEEESQKLQDLIDKGVDISKLGEKPDSVPDAAGAPSKTPSTQEQGDPGSEVTTESRDNSEPATSIKSQPQLGDDDSKISSGLDSSEKQDGTDEVSDNEGNSDENETKDRELDLNSAGLEGKKDQSLTEKDNMQEEVGDKASESTEEDTEGKLQKQATVEDSTDNVDLQQQEEEEEDVQTKLEEKNLPQSPVSTEATNPEDESDVSKNGHGDLDSKKEGETPDVSSKGIDQSDNELGQETGKSPNQQRDSEYGDSLGNSDVTRVNLEELKKLEGELGTAKNALSALLARL